MSSQPPTHQAHQKPEDSKTTLKRHAKLFLGLLGSAILALILAFVLGAISVSGVNSTTAANVFLWIAFAVFVTALFAVGILSRPTASPRKSGLIAGVLAVAGFGALWGRHELSLWLYRSKLQSQSAQATGPIPSPIPRPVPQVIPQQQSKPPKPTNPSPQSIVHPPKYASARAGHGNQTVGDVDCTANSGNCAGINNGNQIVNQYGAQKLGMTDAQQAAIRNDMKPFAGLQFTIFRHDATPDSSAFADKLRDALTGAGMICARDTSGQQFNGDGSAVPSGMSLQIGSNSQRAAKALADAMSAAGLITKPISASMNNVRPDAFDITVAPNR